MTTTANQNLAPRTECAEARPSRGAGQAPRANEPDLPSLNFSCRLLSSPDEAEPRLPAWRRLAETALEPNSFHEPSVLMPAWRHLDPESQVRLLAIEAPPRVHPQGAPVLCGLVPLVRRRWCYGLPASCWEVWTHPYSFLGTPLVRSDCAREVVDCLLGWVGQGPLGSPLFRLPMIDARGEFFRHLIDSNHETGRAAFVQDQFCRAQFEADLDADNFLKRRWSRSKRQGTLRLERKLGQLGRLETRWFELGDDLEEWSANFLRIEAAGWKGAQGTALACQENHREFFRELVTRAAVDGRLMMGRLDFESRPIAMIVNLLAPPGGYSFKIAYDEGLASYSPGLLMELALIRRLHAQGIQWMDSCAMPGHPLIEPIWPDRAVRQSLVLSTGRLGGDLAVSLLPLLRWLKRSLSGRACPSGGRRKACLPAPEPGFSLNEDTP